MINFIKSREQYKVIWMAAIHIVKPCKCLLCSMEKNVCKLCHCTYKKVLLQKETTVKSSPFLGHLVSWISLVNSIIKLNVWGTKCEGYFEI